MPRPRHGRRTLLLSAVLACFALVGLGGASSALAAGAWWHLDSGAAPTILPLNGAGQIDVSASDLGYEDIKASVGSPIKLTDVVPTTPGVLEVVPSEVRAFAGIGGRILTEKSQGKGGDQLHCELSVQTATTTVSCIDPESVVAYEGFELVVPVKTAFGAPPTEPLSNQVKVEGGEGGIASESIAVPLHVAEEATKFGVEDFAMTPENAEGKAETQAGAHPFQLTTTLNFNQTLEAPNPPKTPFPEETVPALVRNQHFVLPPGLLGNVNVVPQCTAVQFSTIEEKDVTQCKPETAIGVARVKLNEPNNFHGVLAETVPVFNLVPAAGEPARFGIEIDKVPVLLVTRVRTGSNYAVEVEAQNTTQVATLLGSQVTFWGVPGDPRHDASRGWQCVGHGHWDEKFEPERPCKPLEDPKPEPFITMPAACNAPTAEAITESWPVGSGAARKALAGSETYKFPAFENCQLLGFKPALTISGVSSEASTPTGMNVGIEVPQESTLSASGLAEADVSKTVLKLPGLQVSPAAATGLDVCTAQGFGFQGGEPLVEAFNEAGESAQTNNEDFTPEGISCPPAAKVGTVKIKTPLLKNELSGAAYLARADTDPFTNPLILYLFAEDPESGVKVKLAGKVEINESNGELTSVFEHTPPVPFESLTVSLFAGPRASQATPARCGSYEPEAVMTPSSGQAVEAPKSSYSISSGPNDGPCPGATLPFSPLAQGGSTPLTAAAFTNFSLTVGHADSDQPLTGVTVSLPPGLAAVIAHVTPCPEPPAGQPWSCGEESKVGEALTSSGVGGQPVTLPGQLYLTTGYDGAPFGLLVATHAKAGPFDLGMVYVRSRINVDKNTAAVTVTTDPGPHGDGLPTRIKGVPVDIKQINVTVNRPNFQFNPTNCSEMSISTTLEGAEGATTTQPSRYQAEGCGALPFDPSLTTFAGGHYSRVTGTDFIVKVAAKPGEANIAKTKLVIPEELPSRQTTLEKACLAATFAANPASCSPESIIGEGIVHTPVLKSELRGPAYLVSYGAAKFPDVEFVLQGEGILLILDGQTNIHNGVTTSSFNSVPDAPVSTFEAILPTGPKSILTGYSPKAGQSICADKLSIATTITGQSGAVIERNTPVTLTGCGGVSHFVESNSQKLAKALTTCRSKFKHKKNKRLACERAARKKYGPKPKPKHGKKAAAKKK